MNFLETLKAEFKTIFTDSAIILTVIGGVILYAFFYPQPYLEQSVSSFRVALIDLDRSDVSRKIGFYLDATAAIELNKSYVSVDDAKEAIKEGKIEGLIVLPKHLKRDLYLQRQPSIAIGGDASYFLIFGSIANAAVETLLSENTKIKVIKMLLEEEGIAKASQEVSAFDINMIDLYNPEGSYLLYVIPAVYVLILQQTMLIGLGILGGGYREKAYNYDGNKAPVLYSMIARQIIFMSLFFIHLLFFFGFAFEFFGIYHIGKIVDILTFSFAFLLSVSSLGIFMGALFKTREIATPVYLLSTLPLIFSVGFIWPKEAIPDFILQLTYLFPTSAAVEGFLRINQFGSNISEVIDLFAILLIQSVVYFFLAYLILRGKKQVSS